MFFWGYIYICKDGNFGMCYVFGNFSVCIYIDIVCRRSDYGFDLVGVEERWVGKGCIEKLRRYDFGGVVFVFIWF